MIEANFETDQHGEEYPEGEGALGESCNGEKDEGKPTEPDGECVAGREDQQRGACGK